MVSDQKLRTSLVENSFQLVSNHTLEIQTKKIIEIISKGLKSIDNTD